MKKIIYIAGTVTVLTSFVFTILGKMGLSDLVLINTTVLGILFGWYQKLEKQSVELDYELQAESLALANKRIISSKNANSELYNRIVLLQKKEEMSKVSVIVDESITEAPVTKTKRTRKAKK